MKIIILVIILKLIIIPVYTQESENGAFLSPNGIYVYTGNFIASGTNPFNNITGFRIERREANVDDWDLITEFQSPHTLDEFKNNLESAVNEMPVKISISDMPAEIIWEKAVKYSQIDSIGIWGLSLQVQRALGTVYLDRSVPNEGKYIYKVSYLTANGSVSYYTQHSPVYYPSKKEAISIEIIESSFDFDRVTILTRSVTNSSGLRMMKVFRKENPGGSHKEVSCKFFVFYNNDTAYISLTDSTVEINKTYEYLLQPYDRFGNPGQFTPPILIAAYNINESISIKNIKIETLNTTGFLKISWSTLSFMNISSIKIFKSLDMDTGYYQIAEIPASETEYTDENTEPRQKYYYYISCTDLTGNESARSAKVFAITEYTQLPSNRPYIAGSESLKDGIRIYFVATDEYTAGFRIYRDNGLGDSLAQISDLIPYKDSLMNYIDTSSSLSGALQYRYAVISENFSGVMSQLSNIITERPDKPVIPLTPDKLEVIVRENSAWLYWDDMNKGDFDIIGYSVFRRQVSESGAPLSDFLPLADTMNLLEYNNFVDTAVIPGSSYQYAVQSVNIYGIRSSLSNFATAQLEIKTDYMIPPSGLRAQQVFEGIILNWGEIETERLAGYRIYRYKRGEDPTPVATVNTAVQYTDKTVLNGELYFYYITSLYIDGKESRPGEEISIRRQ